MAAGVDPSVPNPDIQSPQRPYLTESSPQNVATIPNEINEQATSGEPAPSSSFVDLLLPKNTPPSPSMNTPPPEKEEPPAIPGTISPAELASPTDPAPSPEELDDHTEPADKSELLLPEEKTPEESMSNKPMYPPPVSPTQTYQPPVPSLSMMHVRKSSTAVDPPTSKFNRRSWHPSENERISASISLISHSSGKQSSGKINRSASIASSGASSAYSANSATIRIPEPGVNAYTKKFDHKRQQSDPKYVRFMSAVSENQKKTEPERYVGYPGLVSHMTETQNLIFRRFDEVHVRLLLYVQDQIVQLETQLRKLDDQNIAEKGMHNGTFREDVDRVRVEIMERLRILVGEYDTMILAFSRMQESKASEKAVGRLKDWLKKYSGASAGRQSPPTGGAIAKNELEWMEKANDLTNLSTTTTANTTVAKASPLTGFFPGKKR
jgi:hypothetical protein